MDVLELPRPVINFLRTMAKESCRYALSWDIFGGPDSVTLTLTWKLIDDDPSCSFSINETANSASKNATDDTLPRPRSVAKSVSQTSSSPRRSRRDENSSCQSENASVPAIFRSSRGKSLEGGYASLPKPIYPPQQVLKEHQSVSSTERATPTNHLSQQAYRQRKEMVKPMSPPSDQIYGHLYETRTAPVVKCATISSLSSSSPSPQPSSHPVLSTTHSHNPRSKPTPPSVTPPSSRKVLRSSVHSSRSPISNHSTTNYAKLRRSNHIARHDEDENDDADDDDDTLDPWVKRFECSLENSEHNDIPAISEGKDYSPSTHVSTDPNVDESSLTSGKVKFKSKPDYF